MNPIVIAAGVIVSARIISFISDEFTEAEKKKQIEFNNRIEVIRKNAHEVTTGSTQEIINESSITHAQKCESEIYSFLRNEAMKCREDIKQLTEDLKTTKRAAVQAIHSDKCIHTPMRRNSLELLVRQLEEAQEKCYAFQDYLSAYENIIYRSRFSDDIPTFSWRLPKGYPYVGKVLWVETDQISHGTTNYSLPLFDFQLRLTDGSSLDFQEHSFSPVMVTKVNYACSILEGSIEFGAFKAFELVNSHFGIKATVKNIRRNHIILAYKESLKMRLPKGKLINPNRFPPLYSTVVVYPMQWKFSLKPINRKDSVDETHVNVSELKRDAISPLPFQSIPICFSESDLQTFRDFLGVHKLMDYDGEFLLGLVDDRWPGLKNGTKLKLQFGDIPLFFLRIEEHMDQDGISQYRFRFDQLCSSDEMTFSADDVFIPFDAGFTPYYEGTPEELLMHYAEITDLNDVSAFIWQIGEELRIQDQIRKERGGIGYFYKWESITDQLISVLEQGDSVTVEADWSIATGNHLSASIKNHDAVRTFVQVFSQKADNTIRREWIPQFFVKDAEDNRYPAKLYDNGRSIRILGYNANCSFIACPKTIELFAANIPYAELQQKEALRRFRTGQVVNPFIQAACLNSASIESHASAANASPVSHFYNEDIATNDAQRHIISDALNAPNIYLIQGPPGTGKTTVICELVEQTINQNSSSRILIISQANVAVDNVLSKLVEKYAQQIVRCGTGNKISAKILPLQLQYRCQEYLDELASRRNNFEPAFYQRWTSLVSPNGTNEVSSVLCELVIRSHRLVGATCVGLSKKNIGLERAEFDLVIIDEAGKALPAELLIPLLRAKKAIIIGDQKQLPPVINPILYDEEKIELEERAVSENALFAHSFFERLFCKAPNEFKSMLDTQYRMPAIIGTAISELFYDGMLKNAADTEKRVPVLFPSTITFINYARNRYYHEKKDSSQQLTNAVEARDVYNLVMSIRKKEPQCSIAVITPYRGQKRLICNTFISHGFNYRTDKIAIDTVDAFQGSEADVVVFCTTRSIKPTDFFRDSRRINVALSRPRRELIILGKLGYFYRYSSDDSCLPSLADYIKSHGAVVWADKCDELRCHAQAEKRAEIIISTENLSLPTDYYLNPIPGEAIQGKMEEYFKNGDFLNPLPVKRTKAGFELVGSFDQFWAAQELSLSECRCRVMLK